jgi:sugar phosphate isomerase/epimerase
MVKISAFPKCWINDITEGKIDLFKWIEISTNLECDGLELYTGFFQSHDTDYLKRLRNAVTERRMVVSMICHSPDFTVPDHDEWERQILMEKEMIRVSAEVGSRFCRVLSGQRRPGISIERGIKQVVDAIECCLPEAERFGVTLTMENHFKDGYWKYPEFAQKREVFLQIIDQIQSPYFGVQYDPSNALIAGDDPLDFLDTVLCRIKTMHASDRYLKEGFIMSDVLESMAQKGYPANLEHGIIGKGLNNYPVIFEKLRSVGYDGWISIEDGINGFDEMKQSADFLKKMRAQYFGV